MNSLADPQNNPGAASDLTKKKRVGIVSDSIKKKRVGIILGSASPRRASLLRLTGVEFTARPTDTDETPDGAMAPQDYVSALALKKAVAAGASIAPDDSFMQSHEAAVIIGADTVVVARDGSILGKPADARDAARMLAMLSGGWHEVYTGVALVGIGGDAGARGPLVRHEKTRVRMCEIDAEAINRYVAGGEPFDKAGAYAVQGAGSFFIDRVEGCYYNIVGLPLHLLYTMLLEFGVDLMDK